MIKQAYLLAGLACMLGPLAAEAQVVQLPTYRVFSVGTTVSVPDRGAAYLGGVTRGAWSSSSRGVPGLSQVPGVNRLFTNRSIGSRASSSQAYATATIIDHAELDHALLSEAAARRGEREIIGDTARRAAFLSEFVARGSVAPVASSGVPDRDEVAKGVTAPLVTARAQRREEMVAYLQRAELAEAAGSFGAARCCYEVLLRRGSDEQKRWAAQRLAALEVPRTDEKLARRED